MDQFILNSIFFKSVAMGKTTVATGITTIATGITTVARAIYNSYVATDVDDVIMLIATILLFKCDEFPKS
jgi:hypothetical protein